MKTKVLVAAVAIAALPALGLAADNATAVKEAFDGANQKMMTGMGMQPTGDADMDFVMMMIPHHEGAIDMAKIELQYGKDKKLRALATDIVAAQEKEIAEMKEWTKTHH